MQDSYLRHVWEENPRPEGDQHIYLRVMTERVSSQWRAMSDAEKAVCAILVKVEMSG